LRKNHKGCIETLLLLSHGLIQGWTTVKSISDHLGIGKDQFYNHLKTISLKKWRTLLESCFGEEALLGLKKLNMQSPSSKSRALPVLSLDDSVIRKWMGSHYFSQWFSGQFKQVVSGLDIVLVCLRIEDKILPLKLWIMSKRGPYKKRTQRANLLITSLSQEWQGKGIDLKMIAVSMDAGYTEEKLLEGIRSCGFTKIVGGVKGHYRVKRNKYHDIYEQDSLTIKDLFSEQDIAKASQKKWACSEKVIGIKVDSSSFGKGKILARKQLGKIRKVIAFGISRDAEIWRIWCAHYGIESVFRKLKHLLNWGKFQLKGKQGVYATVVIPFFAFWFLFQCQKHCNCSFEKISFAFQQWALTEMDDFIYNLNLEHFQPKPPQYKDIMGNS